MKAGDVVRVRLPHDDTGGILCILINRNEPRSVGEERPDLTPADHWWTVIYDGELRNIHQDFIREVHSDTS